MVEGAAGDEVRALLFGCVVESVQAVRREARRVLEFVGVAPKELCNNTAKKFFNCQLQSNPFACSALPECVKERCGATCK